MGNFDQIAPNLYNFISYDPLKGLLWNVKCYNGVQLVPFKFFKENPFWGKSGNLGKSEMPLECLESFVELSFK